MSVLEVWTSEFENTWKQIQYQENAFDIVVARNKYNKIDEDLIMELRI